MCFKASNVKNPKRACIEIKTSEEQDSIPKAKIEYIHTVLNLKNL